MLHNILWTGGWDSTFRVLDIVLNKKEAIQPFYIIDSARPSTAKEIQTMQKIKQMIIAKDKQVSSLMMDHIMIRVEEIPENHEITSAYRYLSSQSHLGSQYDWLARYALSVGLNNLELCIHKEDKAEGFIRREVHLVQTQNDSYYKLVENPSIPQLQLFSCFRFPLLDMTKLDMADTARESGFDDVMEVTWFCYFPQKDGSPCGYCNPCKYTRAEGMGRRVPKPTLSRRTSVWSYRLKRKVRQSLQQLRGQ